MNREPPKAAEFSELLGVSPEHSAAWDPFFLRIVDSTPLEARVYFRDIALGVYLSGRHKIRRQIGNSVIEGWSDPGTINMTPPGVEGTWEASASSRAAVVVIRPQFISRAIEEHWGANSAKVAIEKKFLIRDPVIEINNGEFGAGSCRRLATWPTLYGERLRISRAPSDLPLLQPIANSTTICWRPFKPPAQTRSRLYREHARSADQVARVGRACRCQRASL